MAQDLNKIAWYLQIVSRYEHFDLMDDCAEGSVDFHGISTVRKLFTFER